MGTYLCTECGDRVTYSGGVPVRRLCSDCTAARDWETLEWHCPECGHVRRINTFYETPDDSPLYMACAGCSTNEHRAFREFEVQV